MLFMSEFWERFAFYGIRWALTLYIVAQFHAGSATGQADANLTYGSYLALVYAVAIFGGYIADKVLGYQRSILTGAVFMSAGLFMISLPDPTIFKFGLATIVVGNGMFKPIISTIVGKLYAQGDERRDSGFTIFYMGINAGATVAPLLTGWLATSVFGTETMPAYKYVFISAGVGMLISLVWFWFGRQQLKGIGASVGDMANPMRVVYVAIGAILAIPVIYFLLAAGGTNLQYVLTALFVGPRRDADDRGHPRRRGGARSHDCDADHLYVQHPLLDVLRAGGQLVYVPRRPDRRIATWAIPADSFSRPLVPERQRHRRSSHWRRGRLRVGPAGQVNSNPSIPRKFGLGLVFNGLAFLLLMYTLSNLVDASNKVPFWTLFTST
jgi:POT family proton-dependent oligopeptide transporter